MKENIYTTGCKTVRRLWLAAVAVCVAVATCVERAAGLLLKIGNYPAAVLVCYRRSGMVLGCADMPAGSNLGQIEISVRGVALGCVAGARGAAGEFFRSVVNPVLAAA